MSKTLILKPRLMMPGGQYAWHDKFVIGNALQHIAKGLSLMKLAPWISLAGKIEEMSEDAGLGRMSSRTTNVEGEDETYQDLFPISVEIKNSEARLFWEKLKDLPFDSFGSPLVCKKCGGAVTNVPNVGTLVQMLADIADCLGEKMPEAEEDDIISDASPDAEV